ncbi:hypothetical protein ML462_03735 [Gramella lutea]|uniref:PKD domain-containing protein n=1 Tax=Christiangramia lutea TaxID=1607951 RepID=A0A9X1V1R0_9FLAO|nr:hypothetical protein [Christiangramia lutea]MCH4822275.1 hypothetical protein [Christiangramia lutea]
MKIFKILAMLTISLLVFTGCENEEITNYAFQDISAPENVTAAFDISQDDTGTVTITPSGDGASVFQIDLGNGETAEIAAGESVTTVYPEGEYEVSIVAVGSTGLTSEYNQMLNISFKAPENLAINVDQPETNPRNITVSATADNATLFQVYFGDVEDEEPTQLMPGESITHSYTEAGVYELTVIAIGAGAATAEEDEIIIVPEAQDPLKLPVTFDDPLVGYNVVSFGSEDTMFEIVTNPELSGDNSTESMVGAITKAGAAFEGVTFNLSEAVDLSGDSKTFSVKIYSETAFPVLLKLETGVNDERANEVSADHGGTGWETITFNFATDATTSYQSDSDPGGDAIVPAGHYDAISLFLDLAGSAAGTFYVDDLMLVEAAPDCTEETEENIDAANGPINWTFMTNDDAFAFEPFGDIASSIVSNPKTDGINPSCNVQIVDKSTGCATWSGVGKAIPTAIDFTSTDKKIFKLKVLAETQTAEVTLRLEKEPFPDTEPSEDRVAQITEVGVWQELTFDFSDVDDKTFRSIILYFERDAECDGDVYYFDDLIQTDGTGTGGGVAVDPTMAAPTPMADAANVQSIFSDAYSDPAGVNYYPDWGQSTTYEMVSIGGNNAIKYDNANYQGIDIGENIDATAYDYINIDVWSGDYTSIPFFLISSTGENSVNLNVAPNQWNTIQIPLSEYTDQGLDISDVFQFKFDVQPDTGGSFYIDNLYFSRDGEDTGGGDPEVATGFPIDFESNQTFSGVFEEGDGVTGMPVANPDMTGNASATVYEFNKVNGAAWYSGIFHIFPDNIDFSEGTTFTVKVWSPKANVNVRFQLELEGSDASPNISVDQTVSQANTWTTLTFDFSGIVDTNNVYDKFVIFPDYDDVAQAPADGSIYYIDDIEQN